MPRVDVDAGPTVKTQVYPGSLMAMNDGRIVHTWNVWFSVDTTERSRPRNSDEQRGLRNTLPLILRAFRKVGKPPRRFDRENLRPILVSRG